MFCLFSRDSIGWWIVLNFLVYVTLPVRLRYTGILLGIGSLASYIIIIIGLNKQHSYSIQQVWAYDIHYHCRVGKVSCTGLNIRWSQYKHSWGLRKHMENTIREAHTYVCTNLFNNSDLIWFMKLFQVIAQPVILSLSLPVSRSLGMCSSILTANSQFNIIGNGSNRWTTLLLSGRSEAASSFFGGKEELRS